MHKMRHGRSSIIISTYQVQLLAFVHSISELILASAAISVLGGNQGNDSTRLSNHFLRPLVCARPYQRKAFCRTLAVRSCKVHPIFYVLVDPDLVAKALEVELHDIANLLSLLLTLVGVGYKKVVRERLQ